MRTAMEHKPKRGDRFVHARFLAEGARPPYDTDDKYETCIVTRVRQNGATIYYTYLRSYEAGDRRSQWYFKDGKTDQTVRRWL